MTPQEHLIAYHKASSDGINSREMESADHASRAAFHMEKGVAGGHPYYGQSQVTSAHRLAASRYRDVARKLFHASDKPAKKLIVDKARAHEAAAKTGEWDESKHPRDEQGHFA